MRSVITSTVVSPPDDGPPRRRRADARRNQERVLAAAEEAFAVHGVDVPVDQIARLAGVGPGTIYRHFPTKAALAQAVVLARLGKFLDRARGMCDDPDAGQALFTLVRELVQLAAEKKDLVDELARAGLGPDELSAPAKKEMERVLGALWARAQAAGEVRADLDFTDFSSLLTAACMAANLNEARPVCRVVDVVCDGLRHRARPAGGEGPSVASAP